MFFSGGNGYYFSGILTEMINISDTNMGIMLNFHEYALIWHSIVSFKKYA